MDKEVKAVIDFLNYNISLEHSAIIQYLFHAYTIGEESIEGKLEEIAREEMRHLRIFAHTVVDLGGIPAIDKRAPVFLEAPTPAELINFDIEAEKMAIEEYSKQMKKTKDKKINRILQRVIDDETAHMEIFSEIYKEIIDKKKEKREKLIDENKLKIANLLNKALHEQYEKILETLYQSFITRHRNPQLSDNLEERAIDKMKHFGWIAEEISEAGVKPDMDLPEIEKINNEKEIVEFQIKDQEEESKKYIKLASETEEKDLKWILERIAKREIHYTDLKEFLEKETTTDKEVSKIVSALTVGSLFKKK